MKRYTLILLLGLPVLSVSFSYAQTPVSKLALGIPGNKSGTDPNIARLQTNAIVTGTPPDIAYSTPQVYALNQSIPALQPLNIGGAVPPAVYGQVTTVTGGTLFGGSPSGVAVDLSGNCYYTEYQKGGVMKISPSGTSTKLNFVSTPAGLTIDQYGNLFVTDLDNSQIYKIDPNGVKTVFAGNGFYGSVDGPGTVASFSNPAGICIDSQDNLYVIDKQSGKIRKITPSGVVSTPYPNNTPIIGADGISIDSQGIIYVADSPNNRIWKISNTGVTTSLAGNGTAQSIDGTGTSANFNYPTGITVDSQGNLYVCDYKGLKIRKVNPAGVVTTIAGSGNSGLNNGIGNAASFEGPIYTTFNPTGNSLYITDFTGGVLKRLALSGYTIDKALPAGLSFDPTTGIISGTPTAISSPTNYTITAYNGYGSSQAVVNISISSTGIINNLLPSVITLPAQRPDMLGSDNYYNPQGVSTNKETPIIHTSSDPSVAYITADGRVKVVKPGVVTISANQAGNSHYSPALPASQPVTFIEYIAVLLPPISDVTVCTADFDAGGIGSDANFPLIYISSNPAVATVSTDGHIHILSAGTTTITLSEPGQLPLYVSALPQAQTFTVIAPVLPSVSITVDASSPCLGSSVAFTATPRNAGNAPVYQWQVNGINAGINAINFSTNTLADGDQVNCIVTNTDNPCISTYTAKSNTITINRVAPSVPVVSVAASSREVFFGTPVTFTATVKNVVGTVSYQWMVNGIQAGANSRIFSSNTLSNGDMVTCSVIFNVACSTPAVSDPVAMTVVPQVAVPNAFTPNGDGVNDRWEIQSIGSFPDCLVKIYNRYGKLIYQSRGYQIPWDGTVSGMRAPASTYYYVIDIGFKNNVLSGYVTLLR